MAVSEELQYKLCTTYQKLHELRFFFEKKRRCHQFYMYVQNFIKPCKLEIFDKIESFFYLNFLKKGPSCFISVKVDLSLLNLQGLMYLYNIINII